MAASDLYDWQQHGGLDAETITVDPVQTGAPVDPESEHRTIYATVKAYAEAERRPILPAWLRSRSDAGKVSRWALDTAAYAATYHLSRAPKYAAKVLDRKSVV